MNLPTGAEQSRPPAGQERRDEELRPPGDAGKHTGGRIELEAALGEPFSLAHATWATSRFPRVTK